MSVTYDVYVKERDRWSLECEFRSDERDAAIEKAQSLTKRHYVQAVKVIRERYDKITRLMTGSTIFDTSSELGPSTPDHRATRTDGDPSMSLAALDIWTEDENALVQWDHSERGETIDANTIRPRWSLIRRAFVGMLGVIVLGICVATLTTLSVTGALTSVF